MKHRTTIELDEAPFALHYADRISAMGSCFAQEISQRLHQFGYAVQANPFGTLYNPISIRNSLGLLLNQYLFRAEDLFFHKERWHSFQHHSKFSGATAAETLEQINVALIKGRLQLQQSRLLMLTFGTAWVYEFRKTQKVVSNCHQLPANRFHRRRLSVVEIVEALQPLLNYLKQQQPALEVLLTVSPIRHLKDGFAENQLSKATLLLAVQELAAADYIHYFPAYEIMLDDLRDYRYYKKDLIHPNELAVDYIWEQFSEHYLAAKEASTRKKVAKLQKAAQHRSFNPSSKQHQAFLQQQLRIIETLKRKHPSMMLEHWRARFEQQLLTD